MINSLGNILRLTTFGESHGEAIGGILDGMPAGIQISEEYLRSQLNRRRPGQSELSSPRNEKDHFKLLSGIYGGKTTGHPIGFTIENLDVKSSDYSHLENTYRPSHADFTYEKKYGLRDHRGGGRSSARETANWVLGGSLARFIIPDIEVYSFVTSVGNIELTRDHSELDLSTIDSNPVRCPDPDTAKKMISEIEEVKKIGDSLGGVITTVIRNVPIGLGEPIFHKLEAQLSHAMMSLPAVKGFEIGSGWKGTKMRGSEHNDKFRSDGSTKTNFSGGIQGGISNGMEIVFRTAFKPTATIMQNQKTIDNTGQGITLEAKGRHDPCVLPRAVPIVDALSYLVLADMYLLSRLRTI